MKVILLQEVKGRGAEGDVVDVAPGFAVNYLFPRKMAIEATPGNVKQLEQRMHNVQARDEARQGDANVLAAKLEGQVVTISAKVGEEGRLFGSVTSALVGDAISEQLGVDLDRRRIETHGHIKEIGEHPVDVSLYRDIKAQLTVNVVSEGQVPSITIEGDAPGDEIVAEGPPVTDEVAAEDGLDAETVSAPPEDLVYGSDRAADEGVSDEEAAPEPLEEV